MATNKKTKAAGKGARKRSTAKRKPTERHVEIPPEPREKVRRSKSDSAKSTRKHKAKKQDEHAAKVRAAEAAELVAGLRERGIKRAKIGGFDLDGVLRGKYVSLEKLESALAKGFGFCDVIFGWDVGDMLYDNAKVTGWHSGYPDAHAVLDPSTLRDIPWESSVVALLADFRRADGSDHPACGRSLLRRVVARAHDMGFTPRFSAEFEFFLFKEDPQSLVDKHYQDLLPIDPGMFGYSWLRTGQDSELMRDLLDSTDAFGIGLEGLHTETGPGVYEAAIAHDTALAAADKAALFKTTVKEVARRHGLTATFMAKWTAALPGCSGHLHQSLWKGDESAFYDPARPRTMSATMEQYVAGQMRLMQDFTALYSPTINSYKRYVPGLWAPLVPSWGIENRTCAIRIIGLGSSTAQRVEYRQTAADMNPYVAMAACLGAGLYGIENELEPPAPAEGDPGTDGELLPNTLRAATDRLADSDGARHVLGEEFVDHYVRTRDWECREYEKAVTDWELKRYFEII